MIMRLLFGRSQDQILALLAQQAIGGTAVLHEHFQHELLIPADKIRRAEVMHFALAMLTSVYTRQSKDKNRSENADDCAMFVATQFFKDTRIEKLVDFSDRYVEYEPLIRDLVLGKDGALLSLAARVFSNVTGDSAKSAGAHRIMKLAVFVAKFLADHLDFMRAKKIP